MTGDLQTIYNEHAYPLNTTLVDSTLDSVTTKIKLSIVTAALQLYYYKLATNMCAFIRTSALLQALIAMN